MTRCVVTRHREAEANRIMTWLAMLCLLALIGSIWPAAGSVIGWAVGILLVLALTVTVVVRRARIAREVTRRAP